MVREGEVGRRRVLQGGLAVAAGAVLGGCGPPPIGGGSYVPGPGGEWERVGPGEAGWDPAGLEDVVAFVGERRATSFLVVSGGRIVAERYWGTGGVENPRDIASCQKSVVSTLCGVAEAQGLLALGTAVSTYLGPGWSAAAPQDEAAVTVRHLLSMTSGLDPRTLARVAAPGTRWAYNTAAYHKLRPVLEAVGGDGIEALTRRWMGDAIGVSDRSVWAPRAGGATWGLAMTARDMARFGLLVQRSGTWAGVTVVPQGWLARAEAPSQDLNPIYGYLWWLLGRRTDADLPEGVPADLVAALGANDQKVYVCPSLDLVVVRQGAAADEATEARSAFDDELLARLLAARAPR